MFIPLAKLRAQHPLYKFTSQEHGEKKKSTKLYLHIFLIFEVSALRFALIVRSGIQSAPSGFLAWENFLFYIISFLKDSRVPLYFA